LTPENVYQAELTEKTDLPKITISTTWWSSLNDDVIKGVDVPGIDPMSTGAYGVRQWRNKGREWRAGCEASIAYTPASTLNIRSVARYTYEKSSLYNNVPQIPVTGGTISISIHNANINIEPDLEWAPTQNRIDPLQGVSQSSGYAIPNLRLSGTIPWKPVIKWKAGIENIFNEKWRENQDWNNFTTKLPLYRPGRSFYGGISLQN
jgi:iron complex outermembrane recepter protein